METPISFFITINHNYPSLNLHKLEVSHDYGNPSIYWLVQLILPADPLGLWASMSHFWRAGLSDDQFEMNQQQRPQTTAEIYGGFHQLGGIPLAGWFLLGKMQWKRDDLGVSPFLETPIWIYFGVQYQLFGIEAHHWNYGSVKRSFYPHVWSTFVKHIYTAFPPAQGCERLVRPPPAVWWNWLVTGVASRRSGIFGPSSEDLSKEAAILVHSEGSSLMEKI